MTRRLLQLLGMWVLANALAYAGAPAGSVSYFDAGQVRAAFERGAPILETARYKVHASRRVEPGLAEVHLRETDVIYVLEGTAEFVTGGRIVNGKTTAPGEIRGERIEAGQSQQLTPGDIVIVPPNTPHWFKQVEAPFLYYVVKPIEQ